MSEAREHAYTSCSDDNRQNLFYCDACNRAEVTALEGANRALTEQVATLKTHLAAALNDAARAELRARDLLKLAAEYRGLLSRQPDPEGLIEQVIEPRVRSILAAAPDSDARLREVMGDVWERGWQRGIRSISGGCDQDINLALGVKP